MIKVIKNRISKFCSAVSWGIVALFDGKYALDDMTDPVITETERLGRPCDRHDDKGEDWQARDRYGATVKKSFCNKCESKTATEQKVSFEWGFALAKYTIKIDCTTCKKHKEQK